MGSSYPLYDIKYYDNFRACIDGLEMQYGNSPALTEIKRGKSVTRSYSKFASDVRKCSNAIFGRLEQGKKIAIAAANSYDWVVAFFGIACSGNIAVLADINQTIGNLVDMIQFTDCELVFASAYFAENFGMGFDVDIINMGDGRHGEDTEFWNFCEAAGEGDVPGGISISPDDTAVIAFTSGTSDNPKAVMLSQKGLLTDATESVRLVSAGSKVYNPLPLFHMYGLTGGTIAMLLTGAEVCIDESKGVIMNMPKFNPTGIMCVPLVAQSILDYLKRKEGESGESVDNNEKKKKLLFLNKKKPSASDEQVGPLQECVELKHKVFGDLSIMICGGAYLDKNIVIELARYGINVIQGYGMTECGPMISVDRNDDNIPGSAGYVLTSLEYAFDEGELIVRGAPVMQGYYKRDDLTAEMIKDGWLHTGDMGYADENDRIYITGRKKDLIVLSNGNKIAPEEIEAAIRQIPIVGEVRAYGAVAGKGMDDVILAIMVYPNRELTKGMSSYEIIEILKAEVDNINSRNPVFKQIRNISLREDEFEKTSTKKIKRSII